MSIRCLWASLLNLATIIDFLLHMQYPWKLAFIRFACADGSTSFSKHLQIGIDAT